MSLDLPVLTEAALRISSVVANTTDLRSALDQIAGITGECGSAATECAGFSDFVAQQIGHAHTLDDLRQRNAGLRYQVLGMQSEVESRKAVDRARGILARRYRLSDQDADGMLRRQSRHSGHSLRDVAAAIINADKSVRVRRTA